MIILKELKWDNCFSYGADNILNLEEASITQILGPNGSGKSSIALIIEEVLFNKNSKGVKKADIANRFIGDTYSIELNFSVDDDEYTINLERRKTLKIKLTKNGEDISSHTATNTFKSIESILGLEFKTFSQLVYQNTTNSLQFLTATDTNRKKFLIDLLSLDQYVEYFEIFKKLVKEYNSKVVATQSKIDTLENWLSKNNLEGMKVLPKLNLEINTEKDEEALGQLTAEFKNILESNKKISANNLYKEELAGLDMSVVKGPDLGKEQKYDTETKKLGELSAEQRATTSLITKYDKLYGKCPTCLQEIDADFISTELIKLNNLIDSIEADRDALNNKITKIKQLNAKINTKRRAEQEFEQLYSYIDDSLPGSMLNANDFKTRIADLKAKLAEQRMKAKSIIEENARIDRNNTRISVIKEQQEEFRVQLDIVQIEIEDLLKLQSNLEVLKKAFSTNGLLAYKIEYLVKELETIVNEYLSELSGGRFTLTFVVTKDRLNVEITDEGSLVDILSLSSGELARVNTSTLLAIRKLMNSISKSRINVLFLDEVIGVLDDPGREKLVDVLVQETKLNTFIISHEWSHPLLSKLNIIKDNSISSLIKD